MMNFKPQVSKEFSMMRSHGFADLFICSDDAVTHSCQKKKNIEITMVGRMNQLSHANARTNSNWKGVTLYLRNNVRSSLSIIL